MTCSFCGQWFSAHNDDGSCVELAPGREVETYAEFAERTFIDPDWLEGQEDDDDLSYITTCDICGGFPGANCHC